MKYPQIAAALGWTETPDLQEGLHLQPEEAAKIDQIFTANKTALQQAEDKSKTEVEAVNGQLTTANDRVAALEAEVSTANTGLANANNELSTAKSDLQKANDRIAALEAMEGKPSGTHSTQDPPEANLVDKSKKYLTSYDDMFGR